MQGLVRLAVTMRFYEIENSKSYYDEPILQSELFYERQDN